jgi:hypothetical protein
VPAGPGNGDVDELAAADDVHGDVLDEDAQQFLAGQGLDRRALGCAQNGRLLLGEPLVVRF